MSVTIAYTHSGIGFAKNPVFCKVRTNFTGSLIYIHYDIELWNGSAYISANRGEARLAQSAMAVFNVSAYFEGLFSSEFNYPEHFTNIAFHRPGMVVRYRMKVWDTCIVNGVLQTSMPAYSGDLYMADGGISEANQLNFNTAGNTLWNWMVTNQKFVSNRSGIRVTHPKAVERLWWIARTSGSHSIVIKWSGNGSDGSYTESIPMLQNHMYELVVSPNIVESIAGHMPENYSVQIQNLSETIEYSVKADNVFSTKTLIFKTMLGIYDGITLLGSERNELSFTRAFYNINSDNFDTNGMRSKGTVSVNKSFSHTINSGWIESEETMNWALELLESDEVFEIKSGICFAANVATEKVVTYDELTNQPLSFSVDLIPAHSLRGNTWVPERTFINPPYFNKLASYYYKAQFDEILDYLSPYPAIVNNGNIEFGDSENLKPGFDFSNRSFWLPAIEAETWYYFNEHHICPRLWLTMEKVALFGTAQANARIFMRDYTTYPGSLLAILVYAVDLTPEQQNIVGKWLDTYYLITENGEYLWEDGAYLKEQFNP